MSIYTFHQLSEQRIDDYIEIFGQVFGLIPLKAEVIQKFKCSDPQLNYLGFIAYDSANRPVAFYGIFPCKYVINGTEITCAQSGSTMTVATHRGQGLFVRLAALTYAIAQSRGVQFVFGMPNEQSYHGLSHSLKWTFTGRMWAMFIYLPSPRLIKLLMGRKENHYFRNDQNIEFESRQKFLFFKKLNLNSAEAVKFLKKSPQRDLKNYRDKPGFLLYRKNLALWVRLNLDGSLSLGDLFLLDPATRFETFTTLLLFYMSCLINGVPKLRFYCSPNHPVAQFFKFPWIKRKSLPFGYFNLSGDTHLPAQLQITYGDYDTF